MTMVVSKVSYPTRSTIVPLTNLRCRLKEVLLIKYREVKKVVGYGFSDPLFWVFIALGISGICGAIGYLLGMQRGQYDANRRWTNAGIQPENKKESV